MLSPEQIADKLEEQKKETGSNDGSSSAGGASAGSDRIDFSKFAINTGISEDEAYSEGSTTGTKQFGESGETYITEKDYKKHRNSDQTWDAYSQVYGEDAMKEKREGNPDGLSINAFDGLMDKFYDGKNKSAEKPEPIQLSETAAKANAYVDAYEEEMLPNQGTYIFGNKEESKQVNDSFLDAYKLNLKRELKPKEADGSDRDSQLT